jgi:hypothetical protein
LLGWLERLGNIFFYKFSRPTGRPNQTHIQRVPETFTPYSGSSSSSGANVTNEGSCISMPLYAFMVCTGTIVPFTFYLELNSVRVSGSAHLNQKQEMFVCNLTRLVVHSAS